MKYEPFVSIIVPAYNAQKTISSCIDALLKLNYPSNLHEIIIVDNNSSDNTKFEILKYDSKVKYLFESKKGAYAARNTGIKNAKGVIIAFTDSDCIADLNWLDKIVSPFISKEIKIVGGKIKAHKSSTSFHKYCNVFCFNQNLFSSNKSTKKFFGGGNMAMRKSLFKKYGLFKEELLSGGDVEFCNRIIKNDIEIKFIEEAIVKHIFYDSIFTFVRKYFIYGKWHKKRIQLNSPSSYVEYPSYFTILRKYNFKFLFYRIIQDISYRAGFFFGIYF